MHLLIFHPYCMFSQYFIKVCDGCHEVMKSVSVSHLVSGSYVDTLTDSVKTVPI